MAYRKITLEAVVHEDDVDVFTQALNDALDRIEETTTVWGSHGCRGRGTAECC